MAPPIGVVQATSPSQATLGNGNNTTLQQQDANRATLQEQQQQHQQTRHRQRGGLQQQEQQQQQLRLPRTGSDRRQYSNNNSNNSNRSDVNANRKKIRRQGSLKTIQEENMPTPPMTAVVDEKLQLQQPQTRQPLKGTSRGLQSRRSATQQQQQKLMQQQQQQQKQHGIGIPQPPPPPPPLPLHIDAAHHTVSAFIPDDAIPLLFPSSEENGRHGNNDLSQQRQQQQRNSVLPPDPSVVVRPLSSALYNDALRLGYDNLARVLNFHPKYLEIFLKCHLHLLTGDGPLPFTHRAYIGIMAVSRVRCSPLAQTLSRDFLNLGGDPGWLEGLHRAPNKIRNLSNVNKILAHRPWLVRKSHVAELTKNFEQEQWSASELVHALTLLTHFHALTTFVFACGLQRDDDAAAAAAVGSGSSTPPSSPSGTAAAAMGGGAGGGSPMESSWMMDSVVERMQRRFNNQSREELTQEECVKRFFTVGSQTAELPDFRRPSGNSDVSSSPSSAAKRSSPSSETSRYSTNEETLMATTMETMTVSASSSSTSSVDDLLLQRFVEDPDFGYDSTLFSSSSSSNSLPHLLQDEEEDEHLLCVQDYSWQEHGFSVLNRFYDAEGSNLLDDKFSVAENLTYRTMASHSGVDTFVFRRAIWNYIDVIFGIRHDDYDYKDIDELLPTTMKKFIKAAVCFPDKLVKKDYRGSMRELKQSEKVHINILMMEARFQGEMLYALRAVTQHLV